MPVLGTLTSRLQKGDGMRSRMDQAYLARRRRRRAEGVYSEGDGWESSSFEKRAARKSPPPVRQPSQPCLVQPRRSQRQREIRRLMRSRWRVRATSTFARSNVQGESCKGDVPHTLRKRGPGSRSPRPTDSVGRSLSRAIVKQESCQPIET